MDARWTIGILRCGWASSRPIPNSVKRNEKKEKGKPVGVPIPVYIPNPAVIFVLSRLSRFFIRHFLNCTIIVDWAVKIISKNVGLAE